MYSVICLHNSSVGHQCYKKSSYEKNSSDYKNDSSRQVYVCNTDSSSAREQGASNRRSKMEEFCQFSPLRSCGVQTLLYIAGQRGSIHENHSPNVSFSTRS